MAKIIDLKNNRRVSNEEQLASNLIAQIIELRKLEGLTQSEVADGTGLTQAQISNIENGSTQPGITTLAKLAKYFNKEIRLTDPD